MTSLPSCHASDNCVLWRAILRSNFVGQMLMSVASAESLAFYTYWKVASGSLGIAFESPPNSLTRRQVTTYGQIDLIGPWKSYSMSRIRSFGQLWVPS